MKSYSQLNVNEKINHKANANFNDLGTGRLVYINGLHSSGVKRLYIVLKRDIHSTLFKP
jgi:hypothetical protein